MRVRVPAIIDETIALNPDYPASIKRRLASLRDEMAAGAPIRRLERVSAPDYAEWSAALEGQGAIVEGDLTWHNAEWFFAETYAYRCLIEAVRWHETGRDPFAPKKLAELQGEALWRLLDRATAPSACVDEALRRAVEYALWGNRIDLSYAASTERGTDISPDDLLVDDRAELLTYLIQSPQNGSVYIIADNAGSELAMDLVLADCLLRHVCERVVIYLKAHPTFVSDAVTQDVWLMLTAMKRRGKGAAALAARLQEAWEAERLRLVPHPYWNSSRFLWDLPADLRLVLDRARLVIIKGDANYRRTLGDALWSAQTPFSDVVGYLDAPVLCLRTLKSDPIVGLSAAEVALQLDRSDPDWRVNGKRGVIQFKAQSSSKSQ